MNRENDQNSNKESFIDFLKRDDVKPSAIEAAVGLVLTYVGVFIKKNLHPTIGFILMILGLVFAMHGTSTIGMRNQNDNK